MQPFDWKRARRVTPEETEMFRRAIEKATGKPRPPRGRPPKPEEHRYQPVSIRLDPRILAWARREGARLGRGYQTIINEALLQEAGKS